MHKKLLFIFCFMFLSQTAFAHDVRPQNSQAIDLLEYDLARLEIAKQDHQYAIDYILECTAAGVLCCWLSYRFGSYCAKNMDGVPRSDPRGGPFCVGLMGSLMTGACGIAAIIKPWASMLNKMIIEYRIAQINERIALLQKR
ncbi:MAG: hypothetical protein WD055_01870 [Candidatus Dependentiae bacterium]